MPPDSVLNAPSIPSPAINKPLLPAQSLLPSLLAASAGALTVLAFAPYGLWPLQIGGIALLFALVMQATSIRRAAVLGWLYSSAATGAGVHWLYVSLHDIGGMPSWLTVAAIAVLSTGLALLVGLATGGARWLQQRARCSAALTLLLILPATCMLAEWTRAWIFTGFPWLSSGYAHAAAPLGGFAPLIGVYGVGMAAAVVAAALVLLLRLARLARERSGSWMRAAGMALPVILLLGVGQLLRQHAWTTPAGAPITVRLLQGNIPQAMKFDPAQLAQTLGLYDALITQAPADLIATPETALPVTRQQLPPDYLQRLSDFATRTGSHVLVGIPLADSAAQYANAILVLDPAGTAPAGFPVPIAAVAPTYRYDKHHLVPFGEFIPTGFRWFVDFMRMPLGDQTSGELIQPPFAVKDQWVLPNICYEDLFGEEIAAQIRDRAARNQPLPTMLLNVSNIAWFGDTIALPQHLQISQMRTLETGRPMLRSTNTGATAVVGPDGQVQARLAPYTRGVLSASVQGYAGLTPFIVMGNGAVVILATLMLAVAIFSGRHRRTDID